MLACPATSHAILLPYPAAGTCEWPSGVQIRYMPSDDHPDPSVSQTWHVCSGVYVGDHIVLTAAHCVAYTDDVQVHFGENLDAPYWQPSADCHEHPDGDFVSEPSGFHYEGVDLAYCKLSGDHPEPPVIPLLVPNGCQTDYVRHELFDDPDWHYGMEATYVASGCSESTHCIATDPMIDVGLPESDREAVAKAWQRLAASRKVGR